ncbi:MAG TPA: hypothetical protein VLC09_12975 [Polyangiaceae bacterium]|nr:hypothetical protein [Polyangiaceae bacterium]
MNGPARRLAYGALVVYWALLATFHVGRPPGPDQYELAYAAHRVLTGAVPYVDVVDMNWPGYLVYGLADYLPNVAYPVRLLDFLWTLLCGAAAAELVSNIWGGAARWATWVLAPLVYVHVGSHMTGQTDVLAAHLFFPIAWLGLRWPASARATTLAGLLFGVAVAIKPSFAVVGLCLLLWRVFLPSPREPFRLRLLDGLLWGSAGVATVALSFGLVLLLGTPLRQLWDLLFVYNATAQFFPEEVTYRIGDSLWQGLWPSAKWWLPSTLLALLTLGSGHLSARERWLFPTLLVAGLLNFLLQGRYYEYHAGLLLDVLLLLGSAGFGLAIEQLAQATRRRGVDWTPFFGLSLLASAVGLGGFVAKGTRLLDWPYGAVGRQRVRNEQFWNDCSNGEVDDLAHRIASVVPADQPILVWQGSPSRVLLQANRPSSTRFFYSAILAQARPPLPMAAAWNERFVADLRERPPRAVALGRHFHSRLLGLRSPAAQAVEALLQGFHEVGRYGDYTLWLPLGEVR